MPDPPDTVIINGQPKPLKEAIELLLQTVQHLQTANGNLQATLQTNEAAHAATIAVLQDEVSKGRNNTNFDVSGTIPKFGGTSSENVEFFIQKIHQAAILTRWTPQVKLTVLRQFLVDEAITWSQTDDDARTTNDYNTFITLLNERYKQKNTTRYYRGLLSCMTIKRDEDIEVFADRIRATNSKTYQLSANAQVNTAIKHEADQRALDTFLNGLTGDIGEKTRQSLPDTFQKAIMNAVNYQEAARRCQQEETSKPVFYTEAYRSNRGRGAYTSTRGYRGNSSSQIPSLMSTYHPAPPPQYYNPPHYTQSSQYSSSAHSASRGNFTPRRGQGHWRPRQGHVQPTRYPQERASAIQEIQNFMSQRGGATNQLTYRSENSRRALPFRGSYSNRRSFH